MKYKVLPADTIYVDKFHLASEYLLAESTFNREDWKEETGSGHAGHRNTKTQDWVYEAEFKDMVERSRIIVLSAEYSVGSEFNLSDVRLFNTIDDGVYGEMNIYRNIHLPYLHNIKPFFEWMVTELENNSIYDVIKGRQLSYTNFQEVLHNCIIDPSKGVMRHIRTPKDGGTEVVIERYQPIEYDLFNQYTKKILSEGEYPVRMNDNRDYDTNEIKRFIEYAIVESLVCDFFPASRKDVYSFHKEGVDRTIADFDKSVAYQTALPAFKKLCDELVPSSGPAKTKGGEFLRGIMRVIYHMYNDGDNPTNFRARQTSFWAFVNCFHTIICTTENYKLYQEIIPEEEKKLKGPRWQEATCKVYIENDLEGWLLIDMVLFAIRYVETEEGKSANTEEKYISGYYGGHREEVTIDFIAPLGETLSYYDCWVPDLRDQFC